MVCGKSSMLHFRLGFLFMTRLRAFTKEHTKILHSKTIFTALLMSGTSLCTGERELRTVGEEFRTSLGKCGCCAPCYCCRQISAFVNFSGLPMAEATACALATNDELLWDQTFVWHQRLARSHALHKVMHRGCNFIAFLRFLKATYLYK